MSQPLGDPGGKRGSRRRAPAPGSAAPVSSRIPLLVRLLLPPPLPGLLSCRVVPPSVLPPPADSVEHQRRSNSTITACFPAGGLFPAEDADARWRCRAPRRRLRVLPLSEWEGGETRSGQVVVCCRLEPSPRYFKLAAAHELGRAPPQCHPRFEKRRRKIQTLRSETAKACAAAGEVGAWCGARLSLLLLPFSHAHATTTDCVFPFRSSSSTLTLERHAHRSSSTT